MASIESSEALREEEDTSAGESTAFSSPVEFAVDLNARPPRTVAYRQAVRHNFQVPLVSAGLRVSKVLSPFRHPGRLYISSLLLPPCKEQKSVAPNLEQRQQLENVEGASASSSARQRTRGECQPQIITCQSQQSIEPVNVCPVIQLRLG